MRIAVTLAGALIVSMLAVSQSSAALKNRTKSNNTNERVEPSAPATPPTEPVQALKNRTKSNNANERGAVVTGAPACDKAGGCDTDPEPTAPKR